MMNLRILIACLVIGAVTEGLAYWLGLWTYNRFWKRVASLLLVFGLIFGSLSTAVADYPALSRFAAGAIVGVVYEALNLAVLRIFTFPNQRLLFLRGALALSLGAGIPWGLLPLVAAAFR
jgi:hypothetical protein